MTIPVHVEALLCYAHEVPGHGYCDHGHLPKNHLKGFEATGQTTCQNRIVKTPPVTVRPAGFASTHSNATRNVCTYAYDADAQSAPMPYAYDADAQSAPIPMMQVRNQRNALNVSSFQ